MSLVVIREHDPIKCNCDEHKYPTHYNEDHDTYYCPECDVWLETTCDDPDCEYCATRPSKPSEAKGWLVLKCKNPRCGFCNNKPSEIVK
ncbi:MAG: hypothetical protein KAS32_28675 [Candidatus Peribacteraceae bacterium]|nr:hypothetical protein [Candidatus Peribacteraceae bacterium]